MNDPLEGLAYFYGVYLGDGYANISANKKSIEIQTKDADIPRLALEGVRAAMPSVREPSWYNRLSSNGTIMYTACWLDTAFVYQVVLETSNKVYKDSIPMFIWKGSVEVRRKFLAGLFDTDGTSYSKGSKMNVSLSGKHPFMKEVLFICHLAGITNVGFCNDKRDPNLLILKIGVPSLEDNTFNFILERKQVILERWRSERKQFKRVRNYVR